MKRTIKSSMSEIGSPRAIASRIGNVLARLASGDVTRGVVGTILLKGVVAITGFVMFSLAARLMPGRDFGHLVMWLSVAQIVCVIGLVGQEMFITRKLSEYGSTEQMPHVRGALLFSLRTTALVGVASSLMIAAGAALMNEGATLSIALGLFVIGNIFVMLGAQIVRFFVGILATDVTRNFLWRFLVVVVLFVALMTGRTVTPAEVLLAASVGLLFGILAQAVFCWRRLPETIVNATSLWKIRDWFATSARLLPSSILEATNQYLDVIVIYWLLDPVAAGGYYVASRISNLFAILLDAHFSYAARHIPPLYYARRHDELRRQAVLMAEVVTICVVGGLAILVFGSTPLLGAFGEGFIDQRTTLIVLAVGVAFQALGGPSGALLLTTGNEATYTWIVAGNVALRLVGFCALIPAFGVVGAAAAASISLVITTVILVWLCNRRLGFNLSVLNLLKIFTHNRSLAHGSTHRL